MSKDKRKETAFLFFDPKDVARALHGFALSVCAFLLSSVQRASFSATELFLHTFFAEILLIFSDSPRLKELSATAAVDLTDWFRLKHS